MLHAPSALPDRAPLLKLLRSSSVTSGQNRSTAPLIFYTVGRGAFHSPRVRSNSLAIQGKCVHMWILPRILPREEVPASDRGADLFLAGINRGRSMSIQTFRTVLIIVGVILGMTLIIRIAIAPSDKRQ